MVADNPDTFGCVIVSDAVGGRALLASAVPARVLRRAQVRSLDAQTAKR